MNDQPIRYGVPHIARRYPDGLRWVPEGPGIDPKVPEQPKVIVRAADGSGVLLVVTEDHFRRAFVAVDVPRINSPLHPVEPDPPPPEKAAGFASEPWRHGN